MYNWKFVEKINKIFNSFFNQACSELTSLAQTQGKKWQRLLQHERDQRTRLEEQLEQLARQHSALERAALKEAKELYLRSPHSPGFKNWLNSIFDSV